MSFADDLRRTAPTEYRRALDARLAGIGFSWGTDGRRVVDAIASSTGHAYVHPSGVAILLHADGIRFGYPASWATPELNDREAWFDVPYGTDVDVVLDLAAALSPPDPASCCSACYHDDQTLTKVHNALWDVGLDEEQRIDAVTAMQNAGILFRERKPS